MNDNFYRQLYDPRYSKIRVPTEEGEDNLIPVSESESYKALEPLRGYFTRMLRAWIALEAPQGSIRWEADILSEPDRYKAIDSLREFAIENEAGLGEFIFNDVLAPTPLYVDWERLISEIKIDHARKLLGEEAPGPTDLQ
jgi:hypothetical protein